MEQLLKELQIFVIQNKEKLNSLEKQKYPNGRQQALCKSTLGCNYIRVLEENSDWWLCCLAACDLAYILDSKLPDHIHNMIVLGENNEYSKAYVDFVDNNQKPEILERSFGLGLSWQSII